MFPWHSVALNPYMVSNAKSLVHWIFSLQKIMTLDLKLLLRMAIRVASLLIKYSLAAVLFTVNCASFFICLARSMSSSSCSSDSSSSSDETYSFTSFPYSSSESKSGWFGSSFFFLAGPFLCFAFLARWSELKMLYPILGVARPSNCNLTRYYVSLMFFISAFLYYLSTENCIGFLSARLASSFKSWLSVAETMIV